MAHSSYAGYLAARDRLCGVLVLTQSRAHPGQNPQARHAARRSVLPGATLRGICAEQGTCSGEGNPFPRMGGESPGEGRPFPQGRGLPSLGWEGKGGMAWRSLYLYMDTPARNLALKAS